jgi:hypothetical protein
VSKRGGTETISLETIANDDVGLIRRIPMKLGVAARARCTSSSSTSCARTPRSTTRWRWRTPRTTTWVLSRSMQRGLRRIAPAHEGADGKDSGKKLGILRGTLCIPDRRWKSRRSTCSCAARTWTRRSCRAASRRCTRSRTGPTRTTGGRVADKGETPLIEVGFYGGRQDPELFVQDLPTQGSLFSERPDQIQDPAHLQRRRARLPRLRRQRGSVRKRVSLADYQALVDDLVRDKDQVIVSARRDVAITNALHCAIRRTRRAARARPGQRRHDHARTPDRMVRWDIRSALDRISDRKRSDLAARRWRRFRFVYFAERAAVSGSPVRRTMATSCA